TVELDFGNSPFIAGADRYLQVAVRRNSGESYVLLSPRQRITAVPYAIRAGSSGGTASGFVEGFVAQPTSTIGFLVPPVSIPVSGGQKIYVSSSGAFGAGATAANGLNLYICYSAGGSGFPNTVGAGLFGLTEGLNSPH